MKLERAYVDFAIKLSRKGFPLNTIKKYIQAIKKIYEVCWKTDDNRTTLSCREIENYIYSNKKRSDWTKRVIAVQIRAFLKFCSTLWLEVINHGQITIKKYNQKEAKYLNEEEESKMLEELEYEELKLRWAIMLMLTTGARISEATNLTKQQLRGAEKINGLFQIPIQWKGWTTRALFLPEKTYKICEKIANKHNKRKVLWIEASHIQKMIKTFSKNINIKFTAHTLRHTYLTKLAKKGAELYKIQKIAGHKCIITTSRYLHACNKELAETASLLLN